MIDWAALIQPATIGDDCSRDGSGNKSDAAGTAHDSQSIDCKTSPEKCSRVPAVPAVFKDVQVEHENECEPAGGWGTDEIRATDSPPSTRRPVVDYGLADRCAGGGSIIGNTGDTFAELVADLKSRYGDRLDWVAVREQFEERAAIREFDSGMARGEAETKAAADVRAAQREGGVEKSGGQTPRTGRLTIFLRAQI